MGRRAIVLLVALILAGLAAWAVWNFLQSVEEEAQAGQELVTVFRAGDQGIAEGAEGDILLSGLGTEGSLIVESEDQIQDVPADAIVSEEQLRQVLGGRVAAGPISPNAILTQRQWTEVTLDVRPLRDEIPSGKQAITISTSAVQGVNGFVEPGDRVNMIITLDIEFDLIPVEFEGITIPEDTTEEGAEEEEAESVVVTYTRYVLQGLPVIATGRDIRLDADAPPTVEVDEPEPVEGEQPTEDTGNETVFTLEVTPDQAERIVFAFENGSIWLTLVPEDFVEVETNGVIIDNLFGGDLVDQIFGTDN